MTYKQTLQYLFDKLPMFNKLGNNAIKKGLKNIILLCESLDNPQNKFKSIHIAGTNGKGSTSHILASLFQSTGYKTGLYTSPHLFDFRERITINNQFISDTFVVDFVHKIKPHIEKINPSFFEVTVAMAYYYFAQQKVDIAIIETGLGGRLDSTNIIKPILSIITNIGLDHTQILGKTKAKIAFEKAGIIKKNIPAIIGEKEEGSLAVFERKKKIAPVFYAPEFYTFKQYSQNKNYAIFEYENLSNFSIEKFKCSLTGKYQAKNISTILTAVQFLNKIGYHFTNKQIKYGLKNTQQINPILGRWQQLASNPILVVDVAHNADGVKQIMEQLAYYDYKKLHIIMGLSKDKNIEEILKLLPENAYYYFTKANLPRAMDELELCNQARNFSLIGYPFKNVHIAVKNAQKNAAKKDLILIIGSIFLVGEFLQKYIKNTIK